jgi:hypothetical protein
MKSERRKFGMVLLFAVVFTTLAFVSVGCASRTPPGEVWNRTFGGTNDDYAHSVQQTSDGGYIIVGWMGSYADDAFDFWLVKVGSTPLSETATPRSTPSSTPVQTPPPEQKDKTTQTIGFVGGIIFLAAAALLAGMLVGKFHKKGREEPKRDKRKRETHKKSAGSTKDDTRPYYYKVLDVSTDASRDHRPGCRAEDERDKQSS